MKLNSYLPTCHVFIVIILAVFTIKSTVVLAYADTSTKVLAVLKENKLPLTKKITTTNIKFPEALTGNEEESIDYIEKFSTNRRAYIIRTYNKGQKFFPKVTTVLEKHNLPTELKVLLALESAFNGNAVSTAGAVGYWQFMDDVAKEYGLKYVPNQRLQSKKIIVKKGSKKTTPVRDDRKNFSKSTIAAAKYLKDRSRNLNNDLLLIVASYNWGVGNVWNAMKKTGLANPSFWDIKKYLPAETKSYVMNFITLNVIFNNYEKFSTNSLNFAETSTKTEQLGQLVSVALSERGL